MRTFSRPSLSLSAITLTAVLALYSAGCGAQEDEDAKPKDPFAIGTVGKWSSLARVDAPPAPGPSDLCQALYLASGGAGLYEVIEIRENPQADPGYLYIELNLLEAWTTMAPQRPTLRLWRAEPQRSPASALFEVEEDQQLALMLLPLSDAPQSRGFWSTLPSLVMRYDEQTHQVHSPALDAQGLSVPQLSLYIAQLEALLGRPHEQPRDLDKLDSYQPPAGACPEPNTDNSP